MQTTYLFELYLYHSILFFSMNKQEFKNDIKKFI